MLKHTLNLLENTVIKRNVLTLSFLFLLCLPSVLQAEIVIKTNARPDAADFRYQYPGKLLVEALNLTADEFGHYTLRPLNSSLSRSRALEELSIGEIHVYSTATRNNWEERAIPIRIPLRKGIQGYKLLLIKQRNKSKFGNIKSVEDLQKFVMGGGQQWTSTKAFTKLGFNVAGGVKYKNLFKMFEFDRFDFFPRSTNNIYKELKKFAPTMPDMIIEPSLALYLPNPVYLFVSPKFPYLAVRLEKGLNKLIKNGRYDEIFMTHHKEGIERSNLENRRIIYLNNPILSKATPYSRKELWYKPAPN